MSSHRSIPNRGTRRIVTRRDERGKSVFVVQGEPPRQAVLETVGGIRFVELWATESTPALPTQPGDPTIAMKSFTPGPGGSRFRLVEFPAAAEGKLDPAEFLREVREKAPGDWNLEPDHPGMHTTATIDYGVVISGRVWLELDDGAMTELGPGDCVVQLGARHGWRNGGDQPCRVAFVMLGAGRRPA